MNERLEEKLGTMEFVLKESLNAIRMNFSAVVGTVCLFYFMTLMLFADGKLEGIYFLFETVAFGLQMFFVYLTYSTITEHKGVILRLKNILQDKTKNKEAEDEDR